MGNKGCMIKGSLPMQSEVNHFSLHLYYPAVNFSTSSQPFTHKIQCFNGLCKGSFANIMEMGENDGYLHFLLFPLFSTQLKASPTLKKTTFNSFLYECFENWQV